MTGSDGLQASDQPLASIYDCAMLDLDGVVYVGGHAVDGVPEALREARARGMSLAFVTNNASRPPSVVAEHLNDLGVDASPNDVVTSAQAAAREVAKRVRPGAKVLVIGGAGLLEALEDLGLVPVRSGSESPEAVVQGFDPSVDWRQLAQGTAAIREGALWVASNLDLTVPTPAGLAPGNGTLVNAVATALGRQPDVVAGKPYRPLFDETVLRLASQRPLVVGDRLDTDVEGARRCGADSLLVMTGVTDLPTLCAAEPDQRPTYIAWTMEGLLAKHPAPKRVDETSRANGWVVDVDDGGLRLRETGTDLDDGLRAVVAAAWAWRDDHPGRRLALNGLDDVDWPDRLGA